MTQVESMHLGGGGSSYSGGGSRVQWREGVFAGEGSPGGGGVVGGASRDAAGSPSGMERCTPSGKKEGFMRNSTDVTFVSMDGMPCKKIPTVGAVYKWNVVDT
jgi:hypothetical protein